MAKSGRNWLDVARAALGAWLLAEVALQVVPGQPHSMVAVLVAQGILLAVGVLLQTVFYNEGVLLAAPVCYLTGIVLGNAGLIEGGVVAGITWGLAMASRSASFTLWIMTAALGTMTFFSANDPLLLTDIAVVVLPAFIATVGLKNLYFRGAYEREWQKASS